MAPYANYVASTTEPPVVEDGHGDDPVVVKLSSSNEKMPYIVVHIHHENRSENGNNNSDDDNVMMMMKETTTAATAQTGPCSRSFSLRIASNMIFVLASCLYVILAVTDLQYYQSIQGISDDVLLADDAYTWHAAGFVDDDYIFAVGNKETWVSSYQMIYFSAALLFCVVGLLDFIQEPDNLLSLCMIAAGCFGLLSAMVMHKNVYISNIFNAISVHLFMLEAIGLFVHHAQVAHVNVDSRNNSSLAKNPMMQPLQYFIRLGDVSWIGGTLMDVVLSYYALRDTYDLVHAKVSVLSALLWLACSMIYVTATCIAEWLVRKQFRLEEQFEQSHSPQRQTTLAVFSEDERYDTTA